jgi:ketosteroid isomerase-like protein
MSRTNVDLVRRNYEAFANEGLDQWLTFWSDDLDFRPSKGGLDDHGPIRGKIAMKAHIEEWREDFDKFWFGPVELIDAGEQTVVAVERFGGRAKLSGVETDQTCAVVFTIRDGKIARGREYATREEALEAAALIE